MRLAQSAVLVVLLSLLVALPAGAQSLLLPADQRWAVLASREDEGEARELARAYATELAQVRLVRARNGRFAIVAGPLRETTVARARADIERSVDVPSDMYLSRGEPFLETLWIGSAPLVLARAKYDGKIPARVTLGGVTVELSSKAAGSDRVATMTGRSGGTVLFQTAIDDNPAQEPRSQARFITLDSAAGTPQVVFTYFWQGAHCCTVTRIATANPQGWTVLDGRVLDGDGYSFEDLDGDGAAELLSVDNSFLYAFASYAESWAPTRIAKLSQGRLFDVTNEPRFAAVRRSRLARAEAAARSDPALWRNNGFLAGWVAMKAQVGEVDEAWARMLPLYDRTSDFLPEECLDAVALAKCPADRRRKLGFPEGLRAHLLRNGYAAPSSAAATTAVAPSQPAVVSFEAAQAAFNGLREADKYELQMLLAALGQWPAVSTDQFSRRLFDAIQRYQADTRQPVTGSVGFEQMGALRSAAAPVLQRWGLARVAHPVSGHALWVPKGLLTSEKRTTWGLEYQGPDIKVTFDHLSGASLKQLHDGIVSGVKSPVSISFKVLRPDFFVIATGRETMGSYMRFQAVPGGIVGFTLYWQPSDTVLGDRLSTVMSDLFRANVGLGLARRPPAPAPAAAVAAMPVAPGRSDAPRSDDARPSTPDGTARNRSTGTGFFVAGNGTVMTNAHVVDGCGSLTVTSGGRSVPGTVVARDTTNDLAIVRTGLTPPAVAKFRKGLRLGEPVAVFGFPLAGLLADGGNFTLGNVTALAGIRNDSRMIQLSAPVQPGNSGGPLLDESGNVVGVVVAKLNALKLAAATDDLAQNVNFAIKATVVESFAESNGVSLAAGASAETALKPADLADQAKTLSVLVACGG